jgi:hypothetical protein
MLATLVVGVTLFILTASNAGASTPGYWLGANDSGVFAFGAPFFGPSFQSPPGLYFGGLALCTTGCSITSWPGQGGYTQLNTVTGVPDVEDAPPTIDGLFLNQFDTLQIGSRMFPVSNQSTAPYFPVTPGEAQVPVTPGLTWSIATAGQGDGTWVLASNGTLYPQYPAPNDGSMTDPPPNVSLMGMASTPDGQGYWEVASDGGVFAYGDAAFYGSMGGIPLNAPVVGIAPTNDGHGYWLIASDGGVFAYGDAQFSGSMGGSPLNAPMVAMAANPDGNGYWTVAADGGVFAFGDAPFLGSLAGATLNAPVTSIATKA